MEKALNLQANYRNIVLKIYFYNISSKVCPQILSAISLFLLLTIFPSFMQPRSVLCTLCSYTNLHSAVAMVMCLHYHSWICFFFQSFNVSKSLLNPKEFCIFAFPILYHAFSDYRMPPLLLLTSFCCLCGFPIKSYLFRVPEIIAFSGWGIPIQNTSFFLIIYLS